MDRNNSFISPQQARKPFFVGIDLGGTNIKVGMVDDLGRALAGLTIPTEASKGPEDAAAHGQNSLAGRRPGRSGGRGYRPSRARFARYNGHSRR